MVSPDSRFEFAVVGGGMFGAAAARHLAEAGHRVVLVAPMEPLVPESHDGVFASHYDEARITRVLDPDPLWAQLEASTGIRFHHGTGFLTLREAGSALLSATTRVAQAEGVRFEAIDALTLADRMPFLSVGSSQGALVESSPAGYVNPRAFVRAQIEGARAAGASVVAQTVLQITETPDGVDLLANTGSRYLADRALLATGAYTNDLLVRPLDLEVQGRMVLLAELSDHLRGELATMPSIIHEPANGATTYLLPPVTYPDGVTYVKIGVDQWDRALRTSDEINNWFRSGEDEIEAAEAREALVDLIPAVANQPMHMKTCAYTITASGYPYIGMVNDRIGVVVGGNGRGAKSSDEIGRLGAAALLGESIDERLAPRLAS